MASIIRQVTASIPANTAKTSLATVALTIPDEIVSSIDLEVPPGPAGLMGFYLAMSGQQVIPMESGEFVVWDDRFDSWDLSDYPTTGAWSLVGYNLDDFDHAVVVRFHNVPLSVPVPTTPSVVIYNPTAATFAGSLP